MVCGSRRCGRTVTPKARERKPHTREWKFYMVRLRFGRLSGWVRLTWTGRAEHGDRFPLVAAIDSEIVLVNRDYGVPWIQLAHPNQTKIGEIGLTVLVALR